MLIRLAVQRFLLPALVVITSTQAYCQSTTPPPAANPGSSSAINAPTPKKAASGPSASPEPTTQIMPSSVDPLAVRINLSYGHRTWHPSRKQLGATASDNGQTYSVDLAKTTAYLTAIKPSINHAPVNAKMVLRTTVKNWVAVRSSGYPVPVKVFPGRPGTALNIAASAALIQTTLQSASQTNNIALVVKETDPKISAGRYSGIDARIGHYVTHYNAAEVGRTQTVRKAIALVNAHFVAPGDVFSLNKTVGERTAERGFGEGIVFVDGHLDKQLGGGMCQVATTLFNAILLANLKVVERHQHVRTVPYVLPGQDATVYWGQKDFKFQNNSAVPVYISYKTTATHAVCDIYGKANPSVKVKIDDQYQKLGPRHYTAVLKRMVTKNGKTTVDYVAHSAYEWTPKLDYTF